MSEKKKSKNSKAQTDTKKKVNKKSTKKSTKKGSRKNTKKRAKKSNPLVITTGFVIKVILAIILIGIFIGVLCLGLAFLKTDDVKDANFWASKSSTKIYDRDNNLIQIQGEYIKYVELDQVSQYYIDGLLSTEDSHFYKHTGVDFKGMIRAVGQTLFTDSDSGGSTITMQLAKNLYLICPPLYDEDGMAVLDRNGNQLFDCPYNNKIGYKFQQIVYAWKIESKYSKEEILSNYINMLEFDGPKGIEQASEYYFGVEAKNLDLSQAAMLAGMTQMPNTYNPYNNIEAATARRDIVLGNMLKDDKITQEEYDQAKEEKIKDTLVDQDGSNANEEYEIIKPFLDELNMELGDELGEDFDINQLDANIYTSLDYDLQKETYNIINDKDGTVGYNNENGAAGNYIQAGSTSLDTQNGEILAIGGGRSGVDKSADQNYGISYLRQPGSTSKPIVDYGPAIEYLDWSTYHQMEDKKVNYTGGPEVENAYQDYYGQMSIQEALSRSTNTVALQTFQDVAQQAGVPKIVEFMSNLGIDDVDNVNEAYSIGGWSTGTTPLEMSGAYAAFGNGGVYNEPHAVRKIEFSKTSPYYDKYGESFEPEYESNRAMSVSTAYMITKMLDPNLPTAITSDLYVKGLGEQGIKTGTSNWPENPYDIPEGGPRDKWVAGYNADITTVIWTGFSGEYEKEGYYFDNYGLWSYNLYKGIMQAAVDSGKEYLYNDKLVKDSDVYSKSIGGVNYYFKKGTSEYEAQKKIDEEAEAAAKIEEEKAKEESESKTTQDDDKSSTSGSKSPVDIDNSSSGNSNNNSNNNNNSNSNNNNSNNNGNSNSNNNGSSGGNSGGSKDPVEI